MYNKKEYQKEYYQKNKEYLLNCNREYRKTEQGKISRKKTYEKYKNNIIEKTKKYYQEHKKQKLDYDRKYLRTNREKIMARHSQWTKTEMGKASRQRIKIVRRVREREIINTLTSQEWLDILKEYDYKCAYCGIEFDENTLPTRDHIIPISKGGNNIKNNIIPACQSCNSRKKDKLVNEFKVVI
jgi:5-methylcytosine-specific restriction endonuclease McrA